MKFPSEDPVTGFGQVGGITAGLAAFALGARRLAQAIRTRPLFKNGEAEAIMRRLDQQQRALESQKRSTEAHQRSMEEMKSDTCDSLERIGGRIADLSTEVSSLARRVRKVEVAQDSETA